MSGEDGGGPPRQPEAKPDALRPVSGRLTITAAPGHRLSTDVRKPLLDRTIVEAYDYKDAAGNVLYQVVRFDPKGFRERKPDGSGGWVWDSADLPLVLYRLPDVTAASTVVVLEGEKDVETAYRLGLPAGWAATTCPFGTRWMSVYGEMLRGKSVVLCPDGDEAGQRHLRQIGRDLVGKVPAMTLIVLPDAIKDLSQWADGKTKEQFAALLQSARPVDFPPLAVSAPPTATPAIAAAWALPDKKIAETYDYKDAAGNTLFQVVRFEPKGFRPRRPDGSGGWTWDMHDLQLVLYRLPDVIAASTVMVLEGEKDVEVAYRLGLPAGWAATTCPFGARWESAYGETLRDKKVVLCADNDAPGRTHMRRIGRDLVGKATDTQLIVLPDEVKDLAVWAEGKTKEQFAALLATARPVDFPP